MFIYLQSPRKTFRLAKGLDPWGLMIYRGRIYKTIKQLNKNILPSNWLIFFLIRRLRKIFCLPIGQIVFRPMGVNYSHLKNLRSEKSSKLTILRTESSNGLRWWSVKSFTRIYNICSRFKLHTYNCKCHIHKNIFTCWVP